MAAKKRPLPTPVTHRTKSIIVDAMRNPGIMMDVNATPLKRIKARLDAVMEFEDWLSHRRIKARWINDAITVNGDMTVKAQPGDFVVWDGAFATIVPHGVFHLFFEFNKP